MPGALDIVLLLISSLSLLIIIQSDAHSVPTQNSAMYDNRYMLLAVLALSKKGERETMRASRVAMKQFRVLRA